MPIEDFFGQRKLAEFAIVQRWKASSFNSMLALASLIHGMALMVQEKELFEDLSLLKAIVDERLDEHLNNGGA